MHIIAHMTVCLPLLLATSSLCAQDDARLKAFLEKITAADTEVRYAARAEGPGLGKLAVLPLAQLMTAAPESIKDESLRSEIATTARLVLDRLVHHAGRPGAEADRKAVAAELVKLLDAPHPDKLRREATNWLGHIGDEAVVPAVARILGDKDRHVRETARMALERIPGAAALAALTQAARSSTDDFQSDLIHSIGRRNEPASQPLLLSLAQSARGRPRLAALGALARLGSTEALPIFTAVLGETDLPERTAAWNEYLRLADTLNEQKNTTAAATIHADALARAPLDHQRERALHQLTLAGDPSSLDPILSGLNDASARVSRLAIARMKALQGPEALIALKRAYDNGKPESRPTILRALHEKDAATAAPLIAQAISSSQADLRVTALDLADKLVALELEPLYTQVVASSSSAAVKSSAVKGLLLIAQKRLDGNDRGGALKSYSQALELAANESDRVNAIRGVAAAGDPRGLDTIANYLKDPLLGTEAANGVLALAPRLGISGQLDSAEKHLLSLVQGDFPRDVRFRAAEELRKLDRDPQARLRSDGYLLNWWLVGPIESADGKGLETKYFPEEVIDLVNEQRIEARKFRWQEYRDVTLNGIIDLVPVFRRSDNRVAYGYTEIESKEARDVVFKLGSDEGAALWLNGERILFSNANRPLKVDEDSVQGRLLPGKNKLLVKIANTGAAWAFVVRMVDKK